MIASTAEIEISPRLSHPGPAPLLPRAPVRGDRLASVDVLRGLVMVLMALDHVRAYFTDVRFDPPDLSQTTVVPFLTRWITHFCAPTFVLLAGVSAWMAGRRRTRRELATFLVTRGLWLVALEFTVVSFGWYFNFSYELGAGAQVIWAIGASMIALAGLVFLPRPAIAVTAVLMIAGHNLLDGITPWALQANLPMTVLSFLNATKYPPSLLYLSMTLGPALLAWAWLEQRSRRGTEWLRVFGQVPLFYYVAHLYVVHALAVAAGVWQGFAPSATMTVSLLLPGYGFGLPVVYLVWAGVVAGLYPVCRGYAELKRNGRRWWWSYL